MLAFGVYIGNKLIRVFYVKAIIAYPFFPLWVRGEMCMLRQNIIHTIHCRYPREAIHGFLGGTRRNHILELLPEGAMETVFSYLLSPRECFIDHWSWLGVKKKNTNKNFSINCHLVPKTHKTTWKLWQVFVIDSTGERMGCRGGRPLTSLVYMQGNGD